MAVAQNVSVATLAKLFDLTDRRIQQLARDGVIPKATRGKYPLVPAIQGYIKYLQGHAFSKEVGAGSYADETTRLKRALADKAEYEAARLRMELAPISTLSTVLGRVGARISAILETIPGKVKRRAPRLTAAEIEVIKKEIVKAQNAAAKVNIELDELTNSAADSEGDSPRSEVA